jgi:threonine/homoserine/homoserine lactone efflux protein
MDGVNNLPLFPAACVPARWCLPLPQRWGFQPHCPLRAVRGGALPRYLGVRTLFDGSGPRDVETAGRAPASGARTFLRGVVVDLLNPQVAIFFLAFLPQFIDQRTPGKFATLASPGAISILFSLVWEATLAVGSARLAGCLTSNVSEARRLSRCAGTLFFGLGLRLAWEMSENPRHLPGLRRGGLPRLPHG